MRLKYLVIMMVMLLPQVVFAEPNANINTNASSIENGNSVLVTVTLSDTAAWNIKIIGSGAATCSAKYADVTSDGKSTTKAFDLTCLSTMEGTIDIKVTGDITSGNGETKDISISKSVLVTRAKSGVNTLSDLKVNGTTVGGFSSSQHSYDFNTTGETINISAVAVDSKSVIEGVGTKSLVYGKNSFNIVVVAENGTRNTYVLVVNRQDNRSNNNYLKELKIDKKNINFNKNTTEYKVELEHSVDAINIIATPEDSKARVNGTGQKKLNDYTNEFKIVVTAENGSTKVYTVKVLRRDVDGNFTKLNDDCSVKDITIKDYYFTFNKDIKNYNVLVENVDKIEFNVVPNDINSKVEILNNDNLKVGLNIVTVRVIAENGNKNEYFFKVYKIGEEEIKEENSDNKEKNNIEKSNNNIIWMIISLFEFIFIVVLMMLLIKKKKTV